MAIVQLTDEQLDVLSNRRGSKYFEKVKTGTKAVKATNGDEDRLGLIFRNIGTVRIYLGLEDVDATSPIMLEPQGQYEDLFSDDEWWAVSPNGNSLLSVVSASRG